MLDNNFHRYYIVHNELRLGQLKTSFQAKRNKNRSMQFQTDGQTDTPAFYQRMRKNRISDLQKEEKFKDDISNGSRFIHEIKRKRERARKNRSFN